MTAIKRCMCLALACLTIALSAGCAPDRNQVRGWYENKYGDTFPDYVFADFTDLWDYSDGHDSLILTCSIDTSYDDCVKQGESSFEGLLSQMKSDAITVGTAARSDLNYGNLAVRIHLLSSDGERLSTVSETGHRTDDNSPPAWGYK